LIIRLEGVTGRLALGVNEKYRASPKLLVAARSGVLDKANIESTTITKLNDEMKFRRQLRCKVFWIIEASDLDVALKLGAEGSKACNRKIEVRPFL